MIYLILYLSHLLADYPFQSNHVALNKSKSTNIAYRHLGIHSVIMIFGFIIFRFFDSNNQITSDGLFIIVGSIILISLSHFVIDFQIKPVLDKYFANFQYKYTFVLFVDQTLHIITLIAIPFVLSKILSIPIQWLIKSDFSTMELVLWVLILLLNLTFVTGTIIKNLFIDLNKNKQSDETYLDDIPNEYNEIDLLVTKKISDKTTINYNYFKSDEVQNYGRLIGYIERLLIFVLIISRNFEGVFLLFGLKTFARYRQFDSKSFSEQFVLGTMISLFIAILLSGFALLIGIKIQF